MGLYSGHVLGLCYFAYKQKWDELDAVERKYVIVSNVVAASVAAYFLVRVILSIARLVSILIGVE